MNTDSIFEDLANEIAAAKAKEVAALAAEKRNPVAEKASGLLDTANEKTSTK